MATSLFAELREPLERLLRLQEDLGRVFERPPLQGFAALAGAGVLPQANIFDSPDGYVVRLEVPGISPEGLTLDVRGNVLRVSGKREQTQRGSLHRRERWSGEFSRSFQLAEELDLSRADASYHHGLLTIRVPRREDSRPRQIAVRSSH